MQTINIYIKKYLSIRHSVAPLFTVAADIKLPFPSAVFRFIELKLSEDWRPMANWGQEHRHLPQQNGKKCEKYTNIRSSQGIQCQLDLRLRPIPTCFSRHWGQSPKLLFCAPS